MASGVLGIRWSLLVHVPRVVALVRGWERLVLRLLSRIAARVSPLPLLAVAVPLPLLPLTLPVLHLAFLDKFVLPLPLRQVSWVLVVERPDGPLRIVLLTRPRWVFRTLSV